MTAQLEISVEGRLGVIALNRPEAINALSLGMIEGITAQLEQWRDDEKVRAVLFEGRGSRGFCSGGDVRAVRALLLEGKASEAEAYFAAEYAMNRVIARYPRPVIALADGIVMGGGIGIAGHAAFRITTPEARYGMPEAAIGFVSDVGVNWILSKAPAHRALLFLMSGLPASGADVLALGLADCAVAPAHLPQIRAALVAAAGAASVETTIVELMQSESIQAGDRHLSDVADQVSDLFEPQSAEEIVAGIADAAEENSELGAIAAALAARSPTSLEAILESHRAARRLQSVEEVLALDLRLASFMARRPDFAEGVRAQLVDRDQAPRWRPDGFAEVPREAIAAAIAAPEPAAGPLRVSTS